MKRYIIAVAAVAAALLFAPTQARADHTNTHTNVITCDFSDLEELIDDLEVSDIQAPNNNARRGRLGSLQNALDAALEGVEDDDVDSVREALEHIAAKADDRKNAWLRGDVAEDITDAIDDLLECLEDVEQDGDDDTENPDLGCFDELKSGNGQRITLENGTYDCDLVLRGNNNRIVGDDNGQTIINGDVLITGNSNVLRDVQVLGTITIRGNNNRLADVDYDGVVNETGNNNTW